MLRCSKASLPGEALPNYVTGFVDRRWANRLRHLSGDEEISGMKHSTPFISETTLKHPHVLPSVSMCRSLAKTVIVDALGFILAWRPRLAMLLGKLAWWLLPWLEEA
jgi:hypothetical protein